MPVLCHWYKKMTKVCQNVYGKVLFTCCVDYKLLLTAGCSSPLWFNSHWNNFYGYLFQHDESKRRRSTKQTQCSGKFIALAYVLTGSILNVYGRHLPQAIPPDAAWLPLELGQLRNAVLPLQRGSERWTRQVQQAKHPSPPTTATLWERAQNLGSTATYM